MEKYNSRWSRHRSKQTIIVNSYLLLQKLLRNYTFIKVTKSNAEPFPKKSKKIPACVLFSQ
jgi:hypothetical protein